MAVLPLVLYVRIKGGDVRRVRLHQNHWWQVKRVGESKIGGGGSLRLYKK